MAQTPSPSPTSAGQEIKELRSSLQAARTEVDQCRQEIAVLREQLRVVQERLGITAPRGGTGAVSGRPASQYPTLADMDKEMAAAPPTGATPDQDLLASKVAEYDQTKVESGSRYKVRLSGMVLMNAFANAGRVDIIDLPNLASRRTAEATGGNTGATLRQTSLGLQVTGPTVAGASSSGDVELDFFGGFPRTNYGENAGLVRLRTAHARLDWPNWTVVAGQDSPFVSPLSPTSYATVGEPAFSWAGNLWVWTPQVFGQRRWTLTENSKLAWTLGLLDAMTEEAPDFQFNRTPTAGEASRAPGVASHVAWNGSWLGQNATVGVGGYYARQVWGFNRKVDSWVATVDFDVPLTRWMSLSGEMYRGQALGGLGGGIWASALFDGDPELATTKILPLNDLGGWSQLKVKPAAKWEFNVAAGAANPFSHDLLHFASPRTYAFTPLARNQSLFVNSIFRPRSNLLLALEYRRLRTYRLAGDKNSADHVNLAIGVSF